MSQEKNECWIGIDIGGTFTDFILHDSLEATIKVDKCLTTPEDPSTGFFLGLDKMLKQTNQPLASVSRIVHGTTLVTNSIIERKGATTGLIVTEGFGDLIYIGKELRYDLYDIGITFPAPLVSRPMIREVKERTRHDGTIHTDLNMSDVDRALDELVERGAESIAVCLLHSYMNNENEKKIADRIRAECPNLYVSASSDVVPVIKEYDRWSTAIANAYVQPSTDRYISNIEKGLAERDFQGEFFLMTSSGGTIIPTVARLFPIYLLESGPVAGAIASHALGRRLDVHNALVFDMGGTTAKGCIIKDSTLLKVYEMEAGRVHRFKLGSGLPILIPNIKLIEIGAGGGSIAHIDARDVVKVGPESAGADPGPACYGFGGKRPTVTDSDLTLGYLDPDFFLGGDKKLDRYEAAQALEKSFTPLGLETVESSWVIHKSVNEEIASAFRRHAAERGIDLRGFDLVVSGGAGPVHAARVAQSLKIRRILFPFAAGVFSAFGLLLSPRSFDFSRTHRIGLGKLHARTYVEIFESMISECRKLLVMSGISEKNMAISKKLDMRYVGQGYEIEVELCDGSPKPSDIDEIVGLFETTYERIYKLVLRGNPIEIMNFKIKISEPEPDFDMFRFKLGEGEPNRHLEPIKGYRKAYFPECGGFVEVPVYDRYRMTTEFRGVGPAIIEERESTCVITPGMRYGIDPFHNIVAYLEENPGESN